MLTDSMIATIAERLRQSSLEFRELEEAHHRLDLELIQLQKRHVLTPAEELTMKDLHKEKLAKKDKMAELIRAGETTSCRPLHSEEHRCGLAQPATGTGVMAQILNPLAVHIRTVKKRLIIIGATILVALMVAFAFSGEMIAWLNRPFPNQLVFYGPTAALFDSIKVSFLAAILASLPVIFYHCWKFIEPALLSK